MTLGGVPEWLAAALLAAALATLGFVGKQILEWIAALKTARRVRRARLVALLSLLNGSAAVFSVQTQLRNRLFGIVTARSPELSKTSGGFEAVFSASFPSMSYEERELHSIIRGYTVNGLKPLNQEVVQWLQGDTEFKLPRSRRSGCRKLARQLAELEPHLLMWLAKYAVWIPDKPTHALVYLADEESHGVPFPKGIEHTIEEALGASAMAANTTQHPTAGDAMSSDRG